MAGSLSQRQTALFSAHGYLFPVPVMPAEEAEGLLDRLRAGEAEHGAGLQAIADCHLNLPWAHALTADSRILDAVESLLGPDIVCCGAQFFIKAPGTPTHVSWHQDGFYWGEPGQRMITAWLALTPSVPENGCMRVLQGSAAQFVQHVETFAADNLLSRGQEAVIAFEPQDAVDVVLAPGQMSLHSALIVHGSAPNQAAFRRIGFAIRYAPGN
ncbi:MAG: phytanoyl-CoA dioxygenase family protein, partial [Burkholderiales bacterium]|nr:phytanoyl-CoA dioxygenase family protein [Burkholderiales bacterium]